MTHPMQDKISMAKLESSECHCYPTFDIGRKKYEGSVLDYHFEIRVEEFENEIEVGFRGENI